MGKAQILGLYAIRRDSRLSREDFVQLLLKSLEQATEPKWSEMDIATWRELTPIILRLFSLNTVEVTSKAVDLAYEYANLFSSARVVTDIRPIYDEAASHVMATVISQTLRIFYTSGDQDLTMSIALDQKDLERLRDSCERAIKKAKTAQELLLGTCKLQTSIPGEEND